MSLADKVKEDLKKTELPSQAKTQRYSFVLGAWIFLIVGIVIIILGRHHWYWIVLGLIPIAIAWCGWMINIQLKIKEEEDKKK